MFLAVWWGLLVLLWACAGRLSCKSSTQPTFFVGILKFHGYVTTVVKFMRSFRKEVGPVWNGGSCLKIWDTLLRTCNSRAAFQCSVECLAWRALPAVRSPLLATSSTAQAPQLYRSGWGGLLLGCAHSPTWKEGGAGRDGQAVRQRCLMQRSRARFL